MISTFVVALALATAPEPPSDLARAEFVGFQTALGISRGMQTAAILGLSGSEWFTVAAMAGGGLGLGISLGTSAKGITPGRAMLLNYGAVWGAWNGYLISSFVPGDDPRTTLKLVSGGQSAGLATGALVWMLFQPSASDVAVMTSMGAWAAAFTAMTWAAFGWDAGDGRVRTTTLLALSNAGVVAGGLAARHLSFSRTELAFIDLSGVAGGLTFGLAALLIGGGQEVMAPAVLGSAAVGALAGVGAGAWAVRHWRAEAPGDVRLSVGPLKEGALVALGGQF